MCPGSFETFIGRLILAFTVLWANREGHDWTAQMYRLIGNVPSPVSILHKSTAGRYRPARYPDGPITARCRFLKNANWEDLYFHVVALLIRNFRKLGAFWIGKDTKFLHADNEDADQNARMRRLI